MFEAVKTLSLKGNDFSHIKSIIMVYQMYFRLSPHFTLLYYFYLILCKSLYMVPWKYRSFFVSFNVLKGGFSNTFEFRPLNIHS